MNAEARDRMVSLIAEMGSTMFRENGKAPFRLYRRKTRKTDRGKPVYVYYCQFWNERLKRYESARSSRQTSRTAAFTWAMSEVAKEGGPREASITLADFAEGFFDEDSAYLTYRAQRGRPMSWNHRRHNATYIGRYIKPFFKAKKLADVTALDIEDFQGWLLKQKIHPEAERSTKTLTPTTANHVVLSLRHILKWAMKKKLIGADPFVGVETLAEDPAIRGVFTAEEVRRIFALGAEAWPDPMARVFNMVAAVTGLRKGELQALRRKSVEEITLPDGQTAALLVVDASWERSGRLKSTKSGKPRVAALPPVVYREVRSILDSSPWGEPDHFIFYSVDPDKPMSHKKIDKDFTRAVRVLKITAEAQRTRRLSFHSWRHWCNSYLVDSGIPVFRVQQVIGHTSLKMTENYFHTAQDFTDVLQATGRMIEGAAK